MKISSYNLSDDEINIVKICMNAANKEDFFPDWEFHSLFGIHRYELEHCIDNFLNLDLNNPVHEAAVKGSLGHLLGYPHGRDKELEKLLGNDSKCIQPILEKFCSYEND